MHFKSKREDEASKRDNDETKLKEGLEGKQDNSQNDEESKTPESKTTIEQEGEIELQDFSIENEYVYLHRIIVIIVIVKILLLLS